MKNKVHFWLKTLIIIIFVLANIHSTASAKEIFLVSTHTDYQNNKLDSIPTKSIDTNKVIKLNKKAWELAPTDFDNCIHYADSALKISKKINWKKGIGTSLNIIGEANRFKGNIQEAIKYHKNALSTFRSLKNEYGMAESMSKLGISFFHSADYPNSFRYFTNAYDIFEKLGNINQVRKNLGYLGILLSTVGNSKDAIKYFEKSLKLARKLNDNNAMAIQLGNLGLAYFKIGEYTKAIKYYSKAIRIFREINDDYNFSIFNANAGLAYMKLGDYNRAYYNLKSSLHYAESINNKFRIAYYERNLGELKLTMAFDQNLRNDSLTKSKLLGESINFLTSSFEKFTQLGSKDEIATNELLLSKAYEGKGDLANALAFYKSANNIQDSIYSVEKKKEIAKLEVAQQMKLKEKEIELLNAENEHQKFVRTSLITFAVFLFLTSIAFIIMFLNKRRRNIQLQENIRIRKETEELLRQNEAELKRHQDQLEELVAARTSELEKEIKERKQTEEDLILAIERSETASKAKSNFLANMSHELRTPLFGILGYSELLSREINDYEKRTMAEGIYRTGSRLLSTLSMILDFARVESDKYEINYREMNIIPELQEVFETFKGIVSVKSLDYELKLHRDVEILFIDISMFKTIVENLINNAIKFTNEGSVIIETDTEENEDMEMFVLRVKDTGIGIKKKNLPIIFKEFKQISEGTNKAYPGTGLGLSIAKRYIQLLGGEISVNTKEGQGSTFEVKFIKKKKVIRQSA